MRLIQPSGCLHLPPRLLHPQTVPGPVEVHGAGRRKRDARSPSHASHCGVHPKSPIFGTFGMFWERSPARCQELLGEQEPSPMPLAGPVVLSIPLQPPPAAPAPRRAGSRGIFSLDKRHGAGERRSPEFGPTSRVTLQSPLGRSVPLAPPPKPSPCPHSRVNGNRVRLSPKTKRVRLQACVPLRASLLAVSKAGCSA